MTFVIGQETLGDTFASLGGTGFLWSLSKFTVASNTDIDTINLYCGTTDGAPTAFDVGIYERIGDDLTAVVRAPSSVTSTLGEWVSVTVATTTLVPGKDYVIAYSTAVAMKTSYSTPSGSSVTLFYRTANSYPLPATATDLLTDLDYSFAIYASSSVVPSSPSKPKGGISSLTLGISSL
jgi:hypothetical protein